MNEQKIVFAVCINNSEYPASLELHKVYQVLPDDEAAVERVACDDERLVLHVGASTDKGDDLLFIAVA